MKSSKISGLVFIGVFATSLAHAGVGTSPTSGILSSKEKCASALNNYLSFRHDTGSSDVYKVQKLENQVDALCEGYQVTLVENNGVMTGVIELAD